jgi:hypothetical protein
MVFAKKKSPLFCTKTQPQQSVYIHFTFKHEEHISDLSITSNFIHRPKMVIFVA